MSHNASFDPAAWLVQAKTDIDAALEKGLQVALVDVPQPCAAAVRHAVLLGGKRLRPMLALAAAELTGAPRASALQASLAVELIHCYSLVHDDMPEMDNDVLRRGQPTVHAQFGQATALLVGDGLQAMAFAWLTQPIAGVDATQQLAMMQTLSAAAGCSGMVGGQFIDSEAQSSVCDETTLAAMHRAKTGALLSAAVEIGARCGWRYAWDVQSSAVPAALSRYSAALGLAFQVVDDVLDATQGSDTLGKTAGKDAAQAKTTYVSLLGVEEAKAKAQTLLQDALQALSPFGAEADALRALAGVVVNRVA